MLRLAVDIGPQIEHERALPLLVGHIGGDRRTFDVGQRFEQVARHGHQGPGVSRGNARLGAAIAHQFDRPAHGRIALAAQCHFNRVVHGDNLGSGNEFDARIPLQVQLGQQGSDRLRLPDEQQTALRAMLEKLHTGRQDGFRPVISAHHVNGQSRTHGMGRARTGGAAKSKAFKRAAAGADARTYSSDLVLTTLRPR
ncbi:hypothetical protein GALL_495260 [mine drainage metagenome]|uniref:Uncharacterized protein n=1 Tax=mine drainage metagenome TaxID=410659 RepID=A0A1J5PCC4_9ZZZZ